MHKQDFDDGPRSGSNDASPGWSSADPTACDREIIHAPGAIQPYGLLLIADRATGCVVAGAGDIEQRLAADWQGRSLTELLGAAVGTQAAALPPGGGGAGTASVAGRDERFHATLRSVDNWLAVELEPLDEDTGSAASRLAALDAIGATCERAVDFQALCQTAVAAFRQLTGFDQVLLYRFHDDAAGSVIAENQDAELASFLNHHFPAADIPKQARALYVRNRIRQIPDIRYTPAVIRPGAQWQSFDMSDIGLRSVSAKHLQYMVNMGFAASASMSVIVDGKLWGLIACHHRTPRQLSYEMRVACTVTAAVLATQIKARDDAETYRQRVRLRSQEDAVVASIGSIATLAGFFADCGSDLCRMLHATGFAAVQGNDVYVSGKCPGEAEIRAIAAWVRPQALIQPLNSNRLSQRFAAAAGFQERASGLLAVTLSTDEPTILMWFRAEQREIIEWAGNPHKMATGPIGELTPRASFAAWEETVCGRAVPWTLPEIEAANRLRRVLLEVRQNRRLRTLNLELSATIADNETLLLQKDFLVKEVHHRVQNSLALVSSFLGIQARAVGSEALSAELAEAQRRLAAVGLVHRRLYSGDQLQTVDLGRYLEDLCIDMTSSMGSDWTGRISFDLAPILVPTDRAVNVGLILTELLINANKYAYAGGAGPIAVGLDQHGNDFQLTVGDHGPGKNRSHEGFGSRMLTAMVKRLAGSSRESDNAPGLLITIIAPVEEPGSAGSA